MAFLDQQINISVPDVNGWFSTLNGYASTAITSANNAASRLLAFTAPNYYPSINFDSIGTDVGIITPTKPPLPTLSSTPPSFPSAPLLNGITLDSESAPTFTTLDPTLNLPKVPNPLEISLPLKDFSIDTSLPFPVSPDTTLPSVPTLLSLNLPEPAAIALPIFDQGFPSSNSLTVPPINFSFNEEGYSDSLLTSVKNNLLTRLGGGTGLNPVVEGAIWNRGRDREATTSLLAERTLLTERASAGFSRPTGAMLSALDQITQETQSKIIDLSRDIMIKQAELEQENLKTTIQQIIALEDILIREYNNESQRSFEVAKYTQDILVEIFKMEVSRYNSEVEAYKAFAVAYQSRVQAELSKIEIFKAEIDAQKLRGDINEQSIRIYLAQIEGVKTNVELYKTLVATVSEKLKVQALKVDIYKTDIEAYSEAVKAKASEYSIYSEQIKGELAKVNVFESQVKAYSSKIEAYAAKSNVDFKKADTQIKVDELYINKYKSEIEAYMSKVKADQLVYQSAVDLYKGQAEIYLADTSVNKTSAELALKQSENVITQNKYKADIAIQNANITLESIKGSYNTLLEAQKSAGSIYSTLSSSALSAIHVSASDSASISASNSESHNYSGSI